MTKTIISYLKFSLYSFGIAILWRITALWGAEQTAINCFIGLVVTLISTYWIQLESKEEINIYKKVLLFVFPSIFLFTLYDKEFFIYNFLTPQFVGILIMLLNLFLLKDLKKYLFTMIFFLIIYFYSFHKFPGWQGYRYENWRDKAIALSSNKMNDSIETNLNSSDYNFLNLNRDTIKITSDKKYSLFITWSEYCKYCKTAFKKMNPVLDTIKKMDTYYIYSSYDFSFNQFLESYKKEENLIERNVLADYDGKFRYRIPLKGDPAFIILDNDRNEIKYLSAGYSKSLHDSIFKQINQLQ